MGEGRTGGGGGADQPVLNIASDDLPVPVAAATNWRQLLPLAPLLPLQTKRAGSVGRLRDLLPPVARRAFHTDRLAGLVV